MSADPNPPSVEAYEALRRAAQQFRSYAEQHAAKGTPDADVKAKVNTGMAVMCERALAARPSPSVERREEVAKLCALHGLGTVHGNGVRTVPNDRWTQEEWERRVLECVPSSVERRCYALADAILAQPATGAVEEEWVLVPRDISPEIRTRIVRTIEDHITDWATDNPFDVAEEVYRDMLADIPAGQIAPATGAVEGGWDRPTPRGVGNVGEPVDFAARKAAKQRNEVILDRIRGVPDHTPNPHERYNGAQIMSTTVRVKDANGRFYAELSELRPGDVVQVDGGFDCIKDGEKRIVNDDGGELWVACKDGRHYLSGQVDDGTACIGVYRAQPATGAVNSTTDLCRSPSEGGPLPLSKPPTLPAREWTDEQVGAAAKAYANSFVGKVFRRGLGGTEIDNTPWDDLGADDQDLIIYGMRAALSTLLPEGEGE